MKKLLSLFLAFIIAFGVVSTGAAVTNAHAEEDSQIYTEGNFVYKITIEKTYSYSTVIEYTDKQSTGEIVIPDSLGGHPVWELGPEAFKGCQCTSVSIPATLRRVDPEAFAYDMPNMEKFTVASANTSLSSDDMGILYKKNEAGGNLKDIVAYPKNAPHTSLEVARTIRIIGSFAFAEVKNLKSIDFPYTSLGTFHTIGSYAFYNAKDLESFSAKALTAIGDYAFEGCSALNYVTFQDILKGDGKIGWDCFKDTPLINNPENYDEDGVLYIGNHLIATLPEADKEYYAIKSGTNSVAGGAFRWNSLREVFLPASIEYIKSNPFARCANIEKFTVEPDGAGELSVDENGVLCSYDYIVAYPNGIYRTCYVVEEKRWDIVDYAFYQSPIKKFYIHSNLDYAGIHYLSLGGDTVTDIYFEGTEEEWTDDFLYVKKRFEKETTAEDVAEFHFESYSKEKHQITVGGDMQATCSCGYTVSYTPGGGNCAENGFVYHVDNGEAIVTAYLYKNSTDALVIPETLGGYPVTEIDCDFAGFRFTSVHIPSKVTKIREGAFANALNIEEFTVAAGNTDFGTDNGALIDVAGYSLFAYPPASSATEYVVPNTLAGIMPYAFCGTKNLKTVTMPRNNSGIYYIYTVGIIYDGAFMNSSVETVNIEGNDFFWMGNEVFKNSQLKEISFSLDKTHLGDTEAFPYTFGYDVFEGTPFLENAEYDEDGVFYYNNILIATKEEEGKTNYAIKDGTTVVAGSAFKWSGLESVDIPASVKCIGSAAFSEATSLKALTADGNNKYFSVDGCGVLYNKDKTKLVAYPVGREETCYAVPSGVTEIGCFAFSNAPILRSVNVPLSVQTFGEFAFGTNSSEHVTQIRYEGTLADWNKISVSRSDIIIVRYDTIAKKYETYTADGHATTLTVTEPGCVKDGSKKYVCDCGYYYTVKINRNGHSYGEYAYQGDGLFSRSCSVCGNVFEVNIYGITLDAEGAEITSGSQVKINAKPQFYASNITYDINVEYDFASSDESVATVDENGVVTALKKGSATVTVTIRGTDITNEYAVTVLPGEYNVEWVVDGKTEAVTSVKAGEKITPPEFTFGEDCEFIGWTPAIPDVMPESDLTFTAVLNKVTKSESFDVSASYAPEAFDEEVTLEVSEIQGDREPGGVYMVEGEYYEQIGLYNIKTVNENSEVIQPNDGCKVTIKLALPEAYKNRTAFVIYHRFTGGGREQLSTAAGTVKVENGYLIFEVSRFSEFEVMVLSPSIKVTRLPSKTVYNYGEELDLTGIKVVFTRADGSETIITRTDFLTVRGYNSKSIGKQTVTLSYGQYKTTFEVEVRFTFWQWVLRIITLTFTFLR